MFDNSTSQFSIYLLGGSLGEVKQGYLDEILERHMDSLNEGVEP